MSDKANEISGKIETLKWEFACADSGTKRLSAIFNMVRQERKLSACPDFKDTVLLKGVSGLWHVRNTMAGWEKAKKANDFSVVARDLSSLIDLVRKKAQKQAAEKGLPSPYEALLDARTPGLRLSHMEKWSQELAPFCRDLWHEAKKEQDKDRAQEKARGGDKLSFAVPTAQQKTMTHSVLSHLGYHFGRGKVADAAHPVCLGTHDDVRIGMRYEEQDITNTYLSLLHEGGHALYRQRLPKDAQVAGVGMDEAMALLFENHVGRTKSGATILNRMMWLDGMAELPDEKQIYDHMTGLRENSARTEADEIRYMLDVILRYRLERAVFDHDYPVEKLPELWRKEHKALTGLEVQDDRDGILQDIHWFGGEFAWFPNYLFGALAAAQIMEAACADDPAIGKDVEQGNSEDLKLWLQKNITDQSGKAAPLDIIAQATGKALSTDAYCAHVRRKYYNKPGAIPEWKLS